MKKPTMRIEVSLSIDNDGNAVSEMRDMLNDQNTVSRSRPVDSESKLVCPNCGQQIIELQGSRPVESQTCAEAKCPPCSGLS